MQRIINLITFLLICLFPASALAALAADSTTFFTGKASATNSIALTSGITTSNNGEIVIVEVHNEHVSADGCAATISGITDTAGLTYHKRSAFQWHPDGGSSWSDQELWWAYDASHRASADIITAAVNACGGHANFDAASMIAMAFTGFTGTNYFPPGGIPFDANPSLPAFATNTSGVSSNGTVGYVISSSGAMALGFWANATGLQNVAPQTGWTAATYIDNNVGANWSIQSIEWLALTTGAGAQVILWSQPSTFWGTGGDALAIAGTATPTGILGSPSTLMGCCQ